MEVVQQPDRMYLFLDEAELKGLRQTLGPLFVTPRDKLNVQLDKLEFDYDILRVLVNAQRLRLPRDKTRPNDEGFSELARVTGISETSIRAFCHGTNAYLSVKSLVRLMAWVGYTDLGEFLEEE